MCGCWWGGSCRGTWAVRVRGGGRKRLGYERREVIGRKLMGGG